MCLFLQQLYNLFLTLILLWVELANPSCPRMSNLMLVKAHSNAQSHDFVTKIYSNIHHKMQSFLVFSYHLFCPTFNNLISMMMTLIFSKNMKNILFIKSNTQSWNYESWNFPKWVELIIQKNNKFSFRIGCFIRWKQILFIFCEKINVISQLFK